MSIFFSSPKLLNPGRLANAIAYKMLPKKEVLAYRPLELSTYTTFRCNVSCTICAVVNAKLLDQSYEMPEDLSIKDFTSIVDEYSKFLVSVAFSGGEPLLNKDLFKMARLASLRGLFTELFTNGLLMKEHIPMILEYMNSVNVSFNGSDAEEYRSMHNVPPRMFEVLVENTARLVELRDKLRKKLKIKMSYVCTRSNFMRIPAFIELAESLRVDEVWFNNLTCYGLPGFGGSQCLYADDDEVVELVKAVKSPKTKIKIFLPKLYERTSTIRACIFPFSVLTIAGGGCVFPCCSIFPPSEGHVNMFSSKEIWNSQVFVDLRRRLINKSLPLPQICLRCNNRFSGSKRRIIKGASRT